MINKEKVIRHIAAEISIARTCKKDFASVDVNMLSDALSLLKGQEAVKVQYTVAIGGLRYGMCPQCNARIDNLVNPKACGFCGQELEWE